MDCDGSVAGTGAGVDSSAAVGAAGGGGGGSVAAIVLERREATVMLCGASLCVVVGASCVGAGVGSNAATEDLAVGSLDCAGWVSAVEAVGAAAGVGTGALGPAAGAAPGRRRAALGANFLPEELLLMKELKVAGACALSAVCAGCCCVEPSSAMVAVGCSVQRYLAAATFTPTWSGGAKVKAVRGRQCRVRQSSGPTPSRLWRAEPLPLPA